MPKGGLIIGVGLYMPEGGLKVGVGLYPNISS